MTSAAEASAPILTRAPPMSHLADHATAWGSPFTMTGMKPDSPPAPHFAERFVNQVRADSPSPTDLRDYSSQRARLRDCFAGAR